MIYDWEVCLFAQLLQFLRHRRGFFVRRITVALMAMTMPWRPIHTPSVVFRRGRRIIA